MTSDRPPRLSASYIKKIDEPGRYSDGRGAHGLSLLARRTKDSCLSKVWSQRIKIAGKYTNLGLGSYPVVTLAMARDKAIDNARSVARGEDIRKPPPKPPTFDEVAKRLRDLRSTGEESLKEQNEWKRIHGFCTPIAAKLVDDISTDDVLNTIKPIWNKKNPTARKVRRHISAVMCHAIEKKHCTSDPAHRDIVKQLPKLKTGGTKHYPSLPHREVGKALATIRDSRAWWGNKYAIIFLALTGVRSENVRVAKWEQMNLEAEQPIWHIPKTKNGDAHDVPLSRQAIEILLYVGELTGNTNGLIFRPKIGKPPIKGQALNTIMKRFKMPAVPHGFRSSIRNWAGRRSDVSHPTAEKILGHKPQDGVVAAYLTDDFFEERTPLMQQWADYLTETMGPVISPKDLRQSE